MRVETGALVAYEQDVTSYNKTLANGCGALGFTVMPVLEDAVSMPQLLSSSLGVTTAPDVGTVLKHLECLTKGGSLDRWNYEEADIQFTFGAIFSFLTDQWGSLSHSTQRKLRDTALVPVGTQLMKSSRLFFRLNEDLSPFMHEVPRFFGTYERFLSNMGVKEVPSSQDYIEFLSDFASECRGFALNPNELKAAVAIVKSITSSKDGLGNMKPSTVVYVPPPVPINSLVSVL